MVRYAMYCASVKIYGIIHGPLLWKSNGKCTLSTLHKYMVSHNAVHFGNKILCTFHIVSYYIQLIGSIIMGLEVQRSAVKCVLSSMTLLQNTVQFKEVCCLLQSSLLCSFLLFCVALCSFVQVCAVLCSFLLFCAIFSSFVQCCAVFCYFSSFVEWAYGTKHLIVWLQCSGGVVQQ